MLCTLAIIMGILAVSILIIIICTSLQVPWVAPCIKELASRHCMDKHNSCLYYYVIIHAFF